VSATSRSSTTILPGSCHVSVGGGGAIALWLPDAGTGIEMADEGSIVAICAQGHRVSSVVDSLLPTPPPKAQSGSRPIVVGWLVWMGKSRKALPSQVRAWVEARERHRLSHAHVQMARELGLNPGKLGKISNHRQEPWKAPLPQFIEHLYLKRFGRERPQAVTPAEKWERPAAAKKPARNAVATNVRTEQ
jgi:hypothetical protein